MLFMMLANGNNNKKTMKLNKLILGITSALICFCSCSKEEVNSEPVRGQKVTMTFGVGTSKAETTRAVVDLNQALPYITWESGDQIEVFSVDGPEGAPFTLSEEIKSLPNWAVFTGTCARSSKYYLLYPAQDDTELVEGKYIVATIPDVQYARKNSFDPNAMIQTGATTDATKQDVALKNTCAFLYIDLPAGCSKVEVKPANNPNWYLAGKVKIETASGESKINGASAFLDGKHTVTLDGIGGVPGTYVICIAPSTECPGLKTTVTYTDNITSVSNTNTNNLQFNSGYFYNLGTVPAKSN